MKRTSLVVAGQIVHGHLLVEAHHADRLVIVLFECV